MRSAKITANICANFYANICGNICGAKNTAIFCRNICGAKNIANISANICASLKIPNKIPQHFAEMYAVQKLPQNKAQKNGKTYGSLLWILFYFGNATSSAGLCLKLAVTSSFTSIALHVWHIVCYVCNIGNGHIYTDWAWDHFL